MYQMLVTSIPLTFRALVNCQEPGANSKIHRRSFRAREDHAQELQRCVCTRRCRTWARSSFHARHSTALLSSSATVRFCCRGRPRTWRRRGI
ncbi:hypothetical protein DENSPDRAFT_578159 [Dentipellis sp. KUC8613]|nr:hypothetical protein DENSPDRAFT_578159 [Dentipellis sp. KUC8613]